MSTLKHEDMCDEDTICHLNIYSIEYPLVGDTIVEYGTLETLGL